MTIQTRISPAKATAIASVGVGAIAFWMSFTSLSDLASMYGVEGAQSRGLPLVVDGLTVVSTIGAATLQRGRWFAWALLLVSTAVSVVGNATHAVVTNGSPIAVGIAVTPPLFLIAVTHLSIMLASQDSAPALVTEVPQTPVTERAAQDEPRSHEFEVAPESTPLVEHTQTVDTLARDATREPVAVG